MRGMALILGLVAFAGCAPTGDVDEPAFAPDYQGISTALLDGDLVQFKVKMGGARDDNDVVAYAECAASQYALIRGYGFARLVRTNVYKEGGISHADAVYTISPTLPRGSKTIDAEVKVADCAAQGIPTV